MRSGISLVLAVCGGGGNDELAFFVVLCLGALYLLPMVLAISRTEDAAQKVTLAVLLIVSIALGGFLFLYPEGINGRGDYLTRFVISLVASGGLALLAARWAQGAVGRAVFVALAGDVLIPGGTFLLFFASVSLGTGCLN